MIPNDKVDLDIAKIKNLPPLPEESVRIISAVNDADITVEELVDVLSLSPVLVARLLGLANSAFFGRKGQIDDLRIAIIQVLGLNLVKSLVLSIVLNVELNTAQCESFDGDYFWTHALVTALIAQKLARRINDDSMNPNIVYTSGLLLNIGLLAAIFTYPAELNEVLSETDRVEGSVLERMREKLGKTQYEIGGVLLNRWKLPTTYQTVVSQFRQPDYDGEEAGVIQLLELSHWVAAYIVDDKMEEVMDFSTSLNKLSISSEFFLTVVEGAMEKKDNIQELASVISG